MPEHHIKPNGGNAACIPWRLLVSFILFMSKCPYYPKLLASPLVILNVTWWHRGITPFHRQL